MQKTFFLKKEHTNKKWYVIDATDLIVGRLAVEITKILVGKNKVDYTPHVDGGDNVIVINADKVVFSGSKWHQKIYYKHTGYVGHLKQTRAKHVLSGKTPERIVQLAVKRMLDYGRMGRRRLGNLHIYCKNEHPHAAQEPVVLDLKKDHPKICIKSNS